MASKAEKAAAAAAAAMTQGKKGDGSKQEQPQPVVLQAGQIVQGYEILKPLGKGKFSIVYMATQVSDGTTCALKKINIFDMMQPKQREKCMKEVNLLKSVEHPNIVKFLGSFVNNQELLIIVEWAEKGDLKRLIRKALANDVRFKDSELWEYSRQLSGALMHMHGRRIMHRDLKPANIFVATDGSLKLGDLGLGRFFNAQTLEAFSKVGTPLYMSPEVLHGAGYDMRSDVWSLGCVLYELAMLKSPFKSDQQLSLYDLFVRISKGEYPPLPTTYSAEWRGLIGVMLQVSPGNRVDSTKVSEVCERHCKALASDRDVPPQSALPSAGNTAAAASAGSARQRPSPLLLMDDIVEKLKLLDCEEHFLRPRGYPLIHRCMFALPVALPEPHSQFWLMYELIQWLLALLKTREALAEQRQQAVMAADASAGPSRAPSVASQVVASVNAASAASAAASVGRVTVSGMGAGDAAAGGQVNATHTPAFMREFEDPSELVKRLVTELAARGVQVSSEPTLAQLKQGHGEAVCVIINELINQELVGRDFHFEAPAWPHVLGAAEKLGGKACELEAIPEVDSEDDMELRAPDEAEEDDDENLYSQAWQLGAQAAAGDHPVIEAVHEAAPIDHDAWALELERVRPKLRIPPPDDSSEEPWKFAIAQARKLSKSIVESDALRLVPGGIAACHQLWRSELDRVQSAEDRLNHNFRDSVAKLAETRRATDATAANLAVSQETVSSLSATLNEVTAEVDRAKVEAAALTDSDVQGRGDALHDPARVTRLKAAIAKLHEESRQLDVKAKCLQSELLNRRRAASSLHAPLQDCDDGSHAN
eukprot:TRINITY_DN110709_c0_g1_i1.p1 TRINITY_DN110709_c0_g1~~TRINITY_DN110709_c0_g1_i1.p1  ORF type:complete len:822 (+),score=202.86 TRINITY_DN110709_c0_g1_i1:156-2621(+)